MLYTVKVAQDKAELCKGSTTDSDSVCEGSNPSSAATENRLFFEKTVFSCVQRIAPAADAKVSAFRAKVSIGNPLLHGIMGLIPI